MPRLGADVRLWVAGSGPDSDRLRATYGGDARIEWLGQVSDEEKFSRLRGADVFCAPSLRGESFGVVLIEAMAAGTTVVASALDGYRNVATDDVDALLVEPGDVDALAEALDRVLGDPALAARLRAAGERRADDFSMDRLAARYAEIYEELGRHGASERPPWRLRASLLRHRLTRMTVPMIALIIVIVIVVLLVIFAVVPYNGLVRLRNQVENAWSQIDVQLKRRIDLIPNLVETVKAYAAHEKETLDAVVRARNAAIAAPDTPAGQADANNQISGALRQLFALSEAYPDLKANQNFLALQEELTATEGRVAYARQFYNDSVKDYNIKLEAFPSVIFARMMKYEKREYFEADEASREVPKVQF